MERHLQKIYRKAYSGLVRSWNEYMKQVEAEVQDKWNDYQEAKALGDKSLERKTGMAYRQAVEGKTLMDDYYKGMIDEVTTQLAHVNETAVAYVNGELPEIYAVNLNGANEFIQGYVAGYQFNLIDKNVARNLIMGNKKYMDYFKQVDIPKDKRWNKKLIHSQMTQGILQGESIPKLAKRFQHVTKSNMESAVRNARTMTTGIENRGRSDGFDKAEQDGIVVNKEWIATGDRRTRDWHEELNGQVIPNNEKFENEYGSIAFPGDPSAPPAQIYNCRCSLAGVVVGFKTKDGKINYV